MELVRRGKTLTLRKRVPKRYEAIEPRRFVWLSLHTDSESAARLKADAAWEQMKDGWEARLRGQSEDAEERFAAARELAQQRGFQYLPAAKVAKLPTDELLARVEAVTKNGTPDRIEAAAVLGGAKEPPITVNRALELFWKHASDRTIGKTDDQLRRWKNPRRKAVKAFVERIGDKELSAITPDDMLDFRAWLSNRIAKGELTAGSANKDLTHLADTLRTVNRMMRLGLVLPFDALAFKEGEQKQRPPFSTAWITGRLVGGLAGLNTEARCIVLGMVNTGYRPSEGAGLQAQHIRLDSDVPHISIEPDGRQLKNLHSRRVIPLTGVSLEAFRECPGGFPTYFGRDKISDTVNKFMRENGLLETPDHSLYSLRHSFEDRMLAAGIDERIRRDLFGHSLKRERYGDGATLEHKQRLLQAIAL